MSKRTIFIGDIHGCFDEFMLLLNKLKITQEDRIYILGDMINKGPKSLETIEYIYQNQDQFKAIKGNHECNFLNYIHGKSEAYSTYTQNRWDQIKKDTSSKPHLIKYIESLPLYREEDNFIMAHAGVKPRRTLEKQSEDDITRIRIYKGKPWYEYYGKGKKTFIYGHWAVQGLQIRENTIGLDTGCAYGKKLTAYILETKQIVQQQALKQYTKPSKINIFERLNITLNTFIEGKYQSYKNKQIKK